MGCNNQFDPVSSDNEVNETVGTSQGSQKTVADAKAENSKNHEETDDYSWDVSQVVQIILNDNGISINGNGATVSGNNVTITSALTYNITGSLSDGQIIINSEDKEIVRLILDGVNIHNSTGAPIYVQNAEKVMIVLADNKENYMTDGTSYVFPSADEDEPNAAIFSKSDLTIHGNGSLTVDGNYNDAIASKDGLIINGGSIKISAIDDGIRGKDYLIVKEGDITIDAKGDGLKSDNDEDGTMGYVLIENGKINITATGDAITAETDALISSGIISLTSGGGSNRSVSGDASAKGIKGTVNIIIADGVFTINSADDAIHSDNNVVINNGTFSIATNDDAVHADVFSNII